MRGILVVIAFLAIVAIGLVVWLYQNYVEHIINRRLLTSPKYKLVVVAIFKNEAVAMREWLQHYMRQGVEHFYMIDNGSTDDWKSQIEGAPVTVYTDAKKHAQIKLYNDYFLSEVIRDSQWVMTVDLDEFMYARKEFTTIPEYLDTLDKNVGVIEVKWKMFGSNGYINQPQSIVKAFTKRKKMGTKDKDLNRPWFFAQRIDTNGKCIVRTIYLKKFDVHKGKVWKGKKIIYPSKSSEKELEKIPIHLNHYAIQSKNWFENVKMTRGDVNNNKKNADTNRNLNYFKKYDWNDITDLELSEIYSS